MESSACSTCFQLLFSVVIPSHGFLGTFAGRQTLGKCMAQSKSWSICSNREQGGLREVRGGRSVVFKEDLLLL